MTRAYYNEHDKFAAAWLRELIADGLIAPGDVDERSIEDVTPAELVGYRQCHFFAGIGVWSLALRLAGWPDDREIWTGSCPCQPFSAAGKGGGLADERHLWPALHWLIAQRFPAIVLGEQVSSDDGLAWLDTVLADLDQAGYTSGALDTCAAGFGAPHIRQRLYWLAYADDAGLERWRGVRERSDQCVARAGSVGGRMAHANERSRGQGRTNGGRSIARGDADLGRGPCGDGEHGGMAHAEHAERRPQRLDGQDGRDGANGGWPEAHGVAGTCGEVQRMADADSRERRSNGYEPNAGADGRRYDRRGGETMRPGPTNGLWRAADWLGCRDGKWRPVAPGSFPLAATGTVVNRVGQLRGAGNALNVAQAQGFIEAVMAELT